MKVFARVPVDNGQFYFGRSEYREIEVIASKDGPSLASLCALEECALHNARLYIHSVAWQSRFTWFHCALVYSINRFLSLRTRFISKSACLKSTFEYHTTTTSSKYQREELTACTYSCFFASV